MSGNARVVCYNEDMEAFFQIGGQVESWNFELVSWFLFTVSNYENQLGEGRNEAIQGRETIQCNFNGLPALFVWDCRCCRSEDCSCFRWVKYHHTSCGDSSNISGAFCGKSFNQCNRYPARLLEVAVFLDFRGNHIVINLFRENIVLYYTENDLVEIPESGTSS